MVNKTSINEKFQFVPLGFNCLTRRVLTETGLMKTKDEGQLSFPFDLCVTFPDQVVNILNNNFEGYIDSIVYDSVKEGYYNTKYNIFYNHDLDCPNDETGYKVITNRYIKRIDNFRNIVKSKENKIYILNNYPQNENVLNNLYAVLEKISCGNFYLIVLDLDGKINQECIDNRIIVCKVVHPSLGHWWHPENLEKFNKLRDDIAQNLKIILSERSINI